MAEVEEPRDQEDKIRCRAGIWVTPQKKRHYEFARLRYITLPKARMEGYLVAMAYNLKKAAGMVSL